MNILVIGSGGREHTLAWKLAQSPKATKLYAVPGNPGMADIAECIGGVDICDNEALVKLAEDKAIDLVVVGPEVPLTNGVVDAMNAAGIKAFGPRKLAAEIEGSKSFSKNLMKKYGIPTAKYEVFTDADEARAYIKKEGAPIVIKADGLAAGKGVIVAMTLEEALDAVHEIMDDAAFGKAGSRVVIEEFMEGEEASLLAFTDGKTIYPMVSSQDHKRAYDGDKGPNTGGMGTYAPAPVMTDEMVKVATERILKPTIAAMAKEGRPYKGCLYAGLMITKEGPKVVEFNARFGDPETEVVLPKLTSDLGAAISAILDGGTPAFTWDSDNATLGVVLASNGYPVNVIKGAKIPSIPVDDASHVYYAGVSNSDQGLVASSGRVLLVETTAPDLKSAQDKVYAIIDKLDTEGMFYRHDIGAKALK